MSIEKNKEIVRRFHTELWAGNDAVVDELVDPNFNSGMGKPDEIKAGVAWALSTTPDLKLDIEDMIGEGDKVVMRWRMSGTNLGPSPSAEGWPMPPTGKPFSYTGITINTVINGKIVADVFENSWLAMLQDMHVAK